MLSCRVSTQLTQQPQLTINNAANLIKAIKFHKTACLMGCACTCAASRSSWCVPSHTFSIPSLSLSLFKKFALAARDLTKLTAATCWQCGDKSHPYDARIRVVCPVCLASRSATGGAAHFLFRALFAVLRLQRGRRAACQPGARTRFHTAKAQPRPGPTTLSHALKWGSPGLALLMAPAAAALQSLRALR